TATARRVEVADHGGPRTDVAWPRQPRSAGRADPAIGQRDRESAFGSLSELVEEATRNGQLEPFRPSPSCRYIADAKSGPNCSRSSTTGDRVRLEGRIRSTFPLPHGNSSPPKQTASESIRSRRPPGSLSRPGAPTVWGALGGPAKRLELFAGAGFSDPILAADTGFNLVVGAVKGLRRSSGGGRCEGLTPEFWWWAL
ncbi:hypothetical protein, partial [Actinoplanes lobatus]